MDITDQAESSSSSNSMRLLKIKTLDNKLFELKVDASMLVKDLKVKVEEISGVPRDRQRMICMGQQLQDQNTVGHYAKDESTWIHLVAKVPQTESATTTQSQPLPQQPQQQNPSQQPASNSQQGAARRPLDIFGGIQIQTASIGDISSLLGNITNVLGQHRSNLTSAPPQISMSSLLTGNNSTGQAQSSRFTLPQPTVTQQAGNAQQTPTNLTSSSQPITISRQIQLPHQEVFNLGQICNSLMGQQSTFPGPPLPQIPNRNSAQLVGSYLSNWQCQVQRTLPYVHRLSELLQREPYMQQPEDRTQTMALSLEVGRALNELVSCTSPMVSVLSDLVLLPQPGQIRFDQNNVVTSPSLSNLARTTQQASIFQAPLFEQPRVSQTPNQPAPLQQPTRQQPERDQQANSSNDNPLNSLFNLSNLGNGQNEIHIVVDSDGDTSQEIRVLGFSNESDDENNNGPNISSVLQGLMQSLGAQNATSLTINASNLNGQRDTQRQERSSSQNRQQQGNSNISSQNTQNTNQAQGATQNNIPNGQANGLLQQMLSGFQANPIINGNHSSENRQQQQQSQQQQQGSSQVGQNQPQPVQQQQTQAGNPLEMMLRGGLMSNIMTMTVEELSRNSMTEEQISPENEQIVLGILGSLRIIDIITSIVSGQFSFLDAVQQKMRDQIRSRGLNREQFADRLATYMSDLMVVPEQHKGRLYEGIEPEGIGYDILDETLPVIYDIIFREYPQNGLERFSSEFMYEFRKIVGRLFSELSECFQNGLTDLEIVFRYATNQYYSRVLGENAAIFNSIGPSMIWEKIKREILTYRQEQEQRQQASQQVQQQASQIGQNQVVQDQPTQQDLEIDLLEDIENGLERDQERFRRYQNIQFSEEYKKGDLTSKKN